MRRWIPLGILASAQFIMVLDSSVMNVSISQIVADLNTTVTGVQSAITMYTLVMAAFMLVGAKLGDILGRDRAFGLGLAVYGLGSLITSLSPNLTVLLIGWSGIEGLGAVLVIPAIAALTAANYQGKERAFAYGMIGGAAGAAIAAGPLIGGYVTTTWSWRYVFVGEVVVVIAVLLVHRRMKRAPKPEQAPKLDYGGSALSAVALGLIVFGILKSSTWGWIKPIATPTIGGHELTPFGFSLVPFLIIGGFVVLGCFLAWEERRERLGRSTLLNRALLKIETLRGGLTSLAAQQLVVMGTFFVLPVYLQVVLGFDAFETGKRLFPMSVSMLAAALAGPKVAVRFGPRPVVQAGLGAMAIASLVLVGTIDVTLNGTAFAVSLIFFGIGAGLLMSQLGNVIMSSVPPEDTNEAGGLQGTAQNLGASLGTALIGSVLLLGLLNGFNSRIQDNPAVPADVKTQIATATEEGIPIVTAGQANEALRDAGLTPAEADAVTADYGNAQLDALKTSMLTVAFLARALLLVHAAACRASRPPGRSPSPRLSASRTAPPPSPSSVRRGRLTLGIGAFVGVAAVALYRRCPRDPSAAELAAAARRGDAGRGAGRDGGVRRTRGTRPARAALPFAWSTAATIEPYVEGVNFFPRIFADVEAASSSVHILMFGWREGAVGTRMAALLQRKLADGVEVRVIVDRFGSQALRGGAGDVHGARRGRARRSSSPTSRRSSATGSTPTASGSRGAAASSAASTTASCTSSTERSRGSAARASRITSRTAASTT